jgi:osmotically inducible lipoprotein OsmB
MTTKTQGLPMSRTATGLVVLLMAAGGLAGCSNLNRRENNALVGGGIGAAGGAVIGAVTGGSAVYGGLLGGAAGAAVGALSTSDGKHGR